MESKQPKLRFKSIKRTFEFEAIYKNGKKVKLSNWLMVVFVEDTAADPETFYGVTVSRKVGKAVLRNKLKRWVRNSAKASIWPKRLYGKRTVFIFRPQPEGFYQKILYSDFKLALENLR